MRESGLKELQSLANKASGGYRSVGTMVYDVLRDAIIQGVLSPGEKLRQETLAEAIGVSRVPVRSALIQLESDGLVEVFDRRGAVVKTLSARQVEEIYDLRDVLESHALTKAMPTVTPERIARLSELASIADSQEEGMEFVLARSDFYAELYDAPNNPMLWDAIQDLRLKVGRYVLGWRAGTSLGRARACLADGRNHSHVELAERVGRGDTDAALQLLREHMVCVREGVVEMMTHPSSASPDGKHAPAPSSP